MRLVNDSFHNSIMPKKQATGKLVASVVFHAGARLDHHIGNCVAPHSIMGGGFVCHGCLDAPVGFDEHEPGRIILLLEQVETGDAGFLEALAGVSERGLPEGFHTIRFHMHSNKDG